MRNYGKFLLAALIILITTLILPQSAYGHANIISSIPAPGEVLEEPPTKITILFSEEVESEFVSISVYDASGNRVDEGFVNVNPANRRLVSVNVKAESKGVYIVSWRVISILDGHLTRGSYPFTVGVAESGKATFTVETSYTEVGLFIAEVLARWVYFAGQAILVGTPIFIYFVWKRTAKKFKQSYPNIERVDVGIADAGITLGRIAIQAIIAANLMLLITYTMSIGASENLLESIYVILLKTRFGNIWSIRMLIIFLLLYILFRQSSPRTNRPRSTGAVTLISMFVLGSAILFTTSLTSHNAGVIFRPELAVLADFTHLLSVSAWIGGLVCLLIFLRLLYSMSDSIERSNVLVAIIPHFSQLAIISIAFITLSGLYSMLMQVASFGPLFQTSYGLTLIAKLSTVMLIIILGALNQFNIHSHLLKIIRRKSSIDLRRAAHIQSLFRRSVSFEVYLAIAALMLVGLLTALSPAAQSPEYLASLAAKSKTFEDVSEGVKITLTIDPLVAGSNKFEVLVSKSDGSPLENVKQVNLEFRSRTGGVGPQFVSASSSGKGVYVAEGSYMALPGEWRVIVQVRRENAYDVFAEFEVDVPAERVLDNQAIIPVEKSFADALTFLAVIIAILSAVFFSISRRRLNRSLQLMSSSQ